MRKNQKILKFSTAFIFLIALISVSFAQEKSKEILNKNRILAIRKIILSFEDYNEKTRMQFVNKKTLVEIELVGDFNLEVLNCCEPYAVIDGKIFDVTRGNSLRIFITMDEMTFKSLKDKSKICVGMSLFSSQEYLVKTCKSNETPNALRLEKKLINKFPTLKENSDIQNKRRYKID